MWEAVFEWCADMFGVTTRSRVRGLIVICLLLFMIGSVLVERWGLSGALFPALIFVGSILTALEVVRARDAVWRAACLDLAEPRQAPPPGFEHRLLGSTALALYRLATAVNDVRRGSYADANERVHGIERDLLRPEEVQLLEAVRAMISLGLGDVRRAAQQAVAALPTGSEELDVSLGRALLSDAWNAPERLRAIDRAWDRAGVGHDPDGALSRLSRLAKVRIDARLLDGVHAAEARRLADEARAIGDDELAAEIDARGRARAYR